MSIKDIKLEKNADGYWQPVYSDAVYAHSRVYFIRAVGTELVKIGFSDEVGRRLRELQCASPHELAIEHLIIGTPAIEAELHRRLKRKGRHVRGEWYRLPDLDAVYWICDDLFMDGLVLSCP